ncbi:T9SS type A sorting domain-containing protein [Psychroserpens sp.]|uniref:T9SS type A sorting domain-containing protein n=1 Tax=Psychroserpens sp. TaxID=2020870 RepID=UPI003859519E
MYGLKPTNMIKRAMYYMSLTIISKNSNYFFLFSIFLISFNLSAQLTSIPDEEFELFLVTENIDSDGQVNGQVLTSDISLIPSLDISGYDISDFTGLEDFNSLTNFQLIDNQVVINTIDFNSNSLLTVIRIIDTPLLSAIDIASNIALSDLTIGTFGTEFDSIDLTNNININALSLSNNNLSELDLSGNSNITSLFINDNPISELDVSNLLGLTVLQCSNSNIGSLDISNNPVLEFLFCSNADLTQVNLNNNANSTLSNVSLFGNPNLEFIYVDNATTAQNNTNWIKDSTATYIDSSTTTILLTQSASNLFLIYDGQGNQVELNSWLNNNGGATVSSLTDVTWTYAIINQQLSDDTLSFLIGFTAEDFFGNTAFSSVTIFYDGFAVAGESTGTNGVLCEIENYDLGDITGLNPHDEKFDNSSFDVSQEGIDPEFSPAVDNIEGLFVDFPDTGAGKFFYTFKVNIITSFSIGTLEPVTIESDAFLTVNDVTISFKAGPNITIAVCDFNTITFDDLYSQLELIDDTEDPTFNPDDFWFNVGDDPLTASPLTEITGPGDYKFNARGFLPECGAEDTIVTLVSETFETYTISDPLFEAYLIDREIDNDQQLNGEIQTCDIASIESLFISDYAISNFSGLENFVGLKNFTMFNNATPNFFTIDFSGNVLLEGIGVFNSPRLFDVNVSQNTALTNITIQTNSSSFDGVDFSQNINLINLNLSGNIGLANLQMPNSVFLEFIDLSDTSISSLSTTNYINLQGLDIENCSNVVSLNLLNNNQLEFLDISSTSISDINLSSLIQLNQLEAIDTDISVLDVSANPLFILNAFDNPLLEIINLKNGVNTQMFQVSLNNNPNLTCILVDSSVYSESATNWFIDLTASYTDNSICSKDATDELVFFDGIGNENDILEWLNNNGKAVVYSPEELVWGYTFNIDQIGNLIQYNTMFNAVGSSLSYDTNATFVINAANFNAGDDFQPIDPNVANGVEADGSLCGNDTFDLSVYAGEGTDFSSIIYDNTVFEYQQVGGPSGVSFTGSAVDFPDTGAGKFAYSYMLSVRREVQFFGSAEPIVLQDQADIWHWLTIPFGPGEDKVLTVCEGADVSLSDLYNQFIIVDGTNDSEFNPDEYWFDSNNISISDYTGPGVYLFNAEDFLPECGGISATVTVTEQIPLNPGTNGDLEIPVGQTVSEMQLFDALQGTPDAGGFWTPALAGPGTYTYTHDNGVCDSTSAEVIVTEDTLSIHAEDALNTIKLYPNPSSDYMYLTGNLNTITSIDIISISGQLIKHIESEFDTINIQELESAIYFVIIKSDKGLKTVRLIKE